MSKLHAKLSASGSSRWINCAGSVAAEAPYPNTSSVFADEGTAAHELGERVLLGGGSAFDWEGKVLPENNAVTVDRDMADYIQQYVDFVRSQKGVLMVEQRVDFSNIVPEGFGTCDALVFDGTHLRVIDLKYGKGIRVDAEENTQGLLYALGALNDYGMLYDIQSVTIAIVQPRLDHIAEWTISRESLDNWGMFIAKSAQAALTEGAKRNPSEKACQWCKAKSSCSALKAKTEEVLMSCFEDMSPSNPDTLSDEQLRVALENKKLIVSWLDAVETVVTDRLNAGEPFAGFKLVAGRSLRAWGNEQEATKVLVDTLGNDAFEPRKVLSVAKAEKLLGKTKAHLLDGLVVKPQGSPTLAPESDSRPSVNVSADDF